MASPTSRPDTEQAPEENPKRLTPQEEWGERIENGRQIARGGREQGNVPGATGDDPGDPRSGQNPEND